jgi:hypothetical protein
VAISGVALPRRGKSAAQTGVLQAVFPLILLAGKLGKLYATLEARS